MSIKIIRLGTGEELLADIKDDNLKAWEEAGKNGYINLDKPAIIVPRQGDDGRTSLAIMPWVPYVEQDCGIDMNGANIMYIQIPCIDLVNAYSQQFGSGLVVPPSAGRAKKIITGPTLA